MLEHSYNEYINIARKIVKKHAPKFYGGLDREILNDEQALGDITSKIIIGELNWNPDYRSKTGTVKTKRGYRSQCGIWAIQDYMSYKHRKKVSLTSLDQETKDGRPLHMFIADDNSSGINEVDNREEQSVVLNSLDDILTSGVVTRKQEKFIRSYYYEERTLKEIAEIHGISRQAVADSIQKGIRNIQTWLVQ